MDSYHKRHEKNIKKWIYLQMNRKYIDADKVEDRIDYIEDKKRSKFNKRGRMTNLRAHVRHCRFCRRYEYEIIEESESESESASELERFMNKKMDEIDEMEYSIHRPTYCQAIYPVLVMHHLAIVEELLRRHQINSYPRKFLINKGLSVTLGKTIYHNTSSFTTDPSNADIKYNLEAIIRYIEPSFEYTSIAINENAEFKTHRDYRNRNDTLSIIIGFGTYYSGGGLRIEDKVYDIRHRYLKFDGKNCEHSTEKWTGGDRFTIVYYSV